MIRKATATATKTQMPKIATDMCEKKSLYQEAFKQKLIEAYKEAQKNQPAPPPQEINIRVSQDGRVTDVQTTKQAATGFQLFSKIAFNP